MPLSPTDRAILEHASNHDERCGGCPLDSLLIEDSPYWRMHCAAEGTRLPSPEELLRQIERLAVAGYLTVSDDPVDRGVLFEEPSRTVLLTDKGEKARATYGERFATEEEDERAIKFVRAYVAELAGRLTFRCVVPEHLPRRFSLLPEVRVDQGSNRINLKYYGGEDHFVLSQGSDEPWSGGAGFSRRIQDAVVAVTDQQETSLWVSMTFRWALSTVYYRLSFNWLHQLSWGQTEREPIVLDDDMRGEAWALVESLIAEARTPT